MLSQRMIAGSYYYNYRREVVQSPLLSAFTTNFYGEFGITDKWTAMLYSPFLTALSRDAGVDSLGNVFTQDNAIGFGDVDLGVKYQLLDKGFKVAAALYLGIPSGDYNAGKSDSLHLGDSEFNQQLMIYASRGLKRGFFTTFFAGYNNRTKGFSSEIHYGAELGFNKNGFTAMLKIYGRNSLFNQPRKDSPIPHIYSDNLEYLSISPQLIYTMKNGFGFTFEAGFAAAGRNIIAAPSLNFGFVYDLKKKKKTEGETPAQ